MIIKMQHIDRLYELEEQHSNLLRTYSFDIEKSVEEDKKIDEIKGQIYDIFREIRISSRCGLTFEKLFGAVGFYGKEKFIKTLKIYGWEIVENAS